MTFTPVDSTAIHSVAYDPATSMMLVRWKSNPEKTYTAVVPQAKFDAFLAADSKGQHYHRNLKHHEWSAI